MGGAIVASAKRHGYGVVGFSRSSSRPIAGCDETRVFGSELDLGGCQALIHLAGENVFGLWTPEKKRRILASRQEGTRALVEAIAKSGSRPEVLVSASAIGFYGDTGEEEVGEESPAGTGFLAEVTQAWEREAMRAQELGVRVVLLRVAVVLGKGGGALAKMLPVFKLGLGGKLGSGLQWMSWIHLEDLCELALFCVETKAAQGPINACAPEPVRNADFTRALAKTLHRPAFFPVPGFLLKTALGEFSRELLDSKRVVSRKASPLGFRFRYRRLTEALWEAASPPAPFRGMGGEQ